MLQCCETNGRGIIAIRNRFLAFKNNASFTNCISEINNVLIDNAENLDVVIPMYNLLEYSKNYKKTTGSFWNYYRDEPNNHPDVKKMVKTLTKEIQRIRKILKLLFQL